MATPRSTTISCDAVEVSRRPGATLRPIEDELLLRDFVAMWGPGRKARDARYLGTAHRLGMRTPLDALSAGRPPELVLAFKRTELSILELRCDGLQPATLREVKRSETCAQNAVDELEVNLDEHTSLGELAELHQRLGHEIEEKRRLQLLVQRRIEEAGRTARRLATA